MIYDEFEKEWNSISIHHINNRKLKRLLCLSFGGIRVLLVYG